MKESPLTRKQLRLMVMRWEGGEVVDVRVMLRELVAVYWENEVRRGVEDII